MARPVVMYRGAPTGVLCITMWAGTFADIPAGWAACDGTGGTLDLRDKWVECDDRYIWTSEPDYDWPLRDMGHTHPITSISLNATGSAHTHSAAHDGISTSDVSAQPTRSSLGGDGFTTAGGNHAHEIDADQPMTLNSSTHTHTITGSPAFEPTSLVVDLRAPYYALVYIQGRVPRDQVPVGGIVLYQGNGLDNYDPWTVPEGFASCDGSNGTPDLRGYEIVAAGGQYDPHDTGGTGILDYWGYYHDHRTGLEVTPDVSHYHYNEFYYCTDSPAASTETVASSYWLDAIGHPSPHGHMYPGYPTRTIIESGPGDSHTHAVSIGGYQTRLNVSGMLYPPAWGLHFLMRVA